MTDAPKSGPAAAPDGPVRYEMARVPVAYRPWVPLAVAAGLAGLAFALLNLPGVLRYPVTPPRAPAAEPDPSGAQRLAALQEHNKSLREQIEQAKRLASRNVCVRDGSLIERPMLPGTGDAATGQPPSLVQPGGTAVAGTPGGAAGATAPVDVAGTGTGTGSGTGTGARAAAGTPVAPEDGGNLLPKPPETMPVPRASVPNFEGNFPELLDKATVLVIAQPSGMGSGFFISPRHIVTNRHVADAAAGGGKFFVTNKLLAGLKPARLVVKSEKGPTGSPDYAVLEIDAVQPAPPIMPLSVTVGRLQRVTAAGFPGIVTASDEKLEALKRGDRTAIPDTVLTQGAVTVVQNRDGGKPIIGHEATISPGNSGGPLVDDCARVVGVNTYGIFDESGKHKVNYALGVASLSAFLKANNIPFQANDSVCQPPAPQAAAVPPAAAPTTPIVPPAAAALPAPTPAAVAPPAAKQP